MFGKRKGIMVFGKYAEIAKLSNGQFLVRNRADHECGRFDTIAQARARADEIELACQIEKVESKARHKRACAFDSFVDLEPQRGIEAAYHARYAQGGSKDFARVAEIMTALKSARRNYDLVAYRAARVQAVEFLAAGKTTVGVTREGDCITIKIIPGDAVEDFDITITA